MRAEKRLSEDVINRLRAEIEDADGNEVFALGFLGEDGSGGGDNDGEVARDTPALVVRIEVRGRGNEGAVLASNNRVASADCPPDVLIHNHPSGFLAPSDNDLAIAAQAAESGAGFYIVDNRVQTIYAVADPVKKRIIARLDPDDIIAALEPGGAISRRLPAYEIRESQLDLMRLIIRGFNENAVVAAEAGTGVGKSFAYLLPALRYAALNEQRIVISTATINLQEQLFNKDIPLVTAALKENVKAVLIKGRGNYLCRRRLDEALREPSLDDDERQQTEDIARWADTSPTGSRSDLTFLPAESLWSKICSESDTCMNMRCPERERCFVMNLRREANDARILVVNHHLLFADLAARRDGAGYDTAVVLPPYSRVIIDEAHTIEDAATSFFSQEFSRLGIYRQLGRLYRKRRAVTNGLLLRLAALLPATSGANAATSRGKFADRGEFADRIEDAFGKIRSAADSLDEAALELCGTDGVFRLTPTKDAAITARLSPEFTALRKHLNSLAAFVRELMEEIPEENKEESTVWEIRSVLRRLDSVGTVCSAFIEYRENESDVMWIERRAGRSGESPWAVFTVTPVNVAPALEEALFEPNKTVVCVSATLTTGKSFDYWKSRAGLNLASGRATLTGIFPSPFPYDTNVLLAAPQDAPLPTDPGYGTFVDAAAAALAEVSGGSALILFTSYQALRSAHAAALPVLQKLGIRVLKQGDDDRARLLATFLDDTSSVLFATDSFWEGVDAPGDTLRLVILCRLPFKSPSDPVFQARCEAAENRGENSFMTLSLPEAVMKFKQGFGRLMRRSSDHGVVVVLDGRLLKKRYGENFLNALPETKTSFTNFDSILQSVERFLYS